MGDEVSLRTKRAFEDGLTKATHILDDSIESTKETNDFLIGVHAIVKGIRDGKIACRVYRKEKFHAKAYITHSRIEVVGASALVGSSNFTFPGLTENIELNVQITGRPVGVLQEWYEEHWNQAEDVSQEILRTIERHTREYSPFEVFARSLQEYFRSHEMTADEWEQQKSGIYKILATYQKHGYHGLLKRARKYGGAFLCDGVGLGKTYIGLMLIERLVLHEKKRVVLFVPKAAREAVWECKIKQYLPQILGGFLSFRIYNHTDLLRKDSKIQLELEQMKEQADVVIIDEAHHFRNTGIRGEDSESHLSRYWAMFDLCENKQVYLLTATPVNNRLTDFQHMTELFSRRRVDYFNMAPLGIHSLTGHIRKLEKAIEAAANARERDLGSDISLEEDETETNLVEAEQVLRDDTLFEELVVQRSRAFVKKSLAQEDGKVLFPTSSEPRVVPYSVKQTYGKLLKMVEEGFHQKKPLFSLAMYYPYDYYTGSEDLKQAEKAMAIGRQMQVVRLIRTAFLKRFESSVFAFKASCETLMKKLIAFYQANADDAHDKGRLEKWLLRNKDITGYDPNLVLTLFPDQTELEMIEQEAIEPEFYEFAYKRKLDPNEFNMPGLLSDTLNDLETIGDFLRELVSFEPKQDKKLQALIQLLRGHTPGLKDVSLQRHKLLIFTEFKDTARYLGRQLNEAGFKDVVEIDSATESNGRLNVIRAFSPYYNNSSSKELKKSEQREIRILISTDVLSEGLNLQDAGRLINYDLHWNPVRLMQRIGRIDRRLDPQVEERIIADHPDLAKVRGSIQYYNFLPPDELNELLTLYKTVMHKTLRISKTFGIENGKLLRPDDDYDILRDFTRQCEGTESRSESLSLEFQKLLRDYPDLESRISSFPNRVFSGKAALKPDTVGVFFCYARPAKEMKSDEWTIEAGDARWYLYDLASEKILEDPYEIAEHIRSTPSTPRVCSMEQDTLIEIRKTMDKYVKNTYLKRVQAPVGVNAVLRTWMELSGKA